MNLRSLCDTKTSQSFYNGFVESFVRNHSLPTNTATQLTRSTCGCEIHNSSVVPLELSSPLYAANFNQSSFFQHDLPPSPSPEPPPVTPIYIQQPTTRASDVVMAEKPAPVNAPQSAITQERPPAKIAQSGTTSIDSLLMEGVVLVLVPHTQIDPTLYAQIMKDVDTIVSLSTQGHG